jgi:hypothetical protein
MIVDVFDVDLFGRPFLDLADVEIFEHRIERPIYPGLLAYSKVTKYFFACLGRWGRWVWTLDSGLWTRACIG